MADCKQFRGTIFFLATWYKTPSLEANFSLLRLSFKVEEIPKKFFSLFELRLLLAQLLNDDLSVRHPGSHSGLLCSCRLGPKVWFCSRILKSIFTATSGRGRISLGFVLQISIFNNLRGTHKAVDSAGTKASPGILGLGSRFPGPCARIAAKSARARYIRRSTAVSARKLTILQRGPKEHKRIVFLLRIALFSVIDYPEQPNRQGNSRYDGFTSA
jgi:hypothetical protein